MSCFQGLNPNNHRLSHPSSHVLHHLIPNNTFPMLSFIMSSFSCNSSHCNKTCKLPFLSSFLTSSYPLELICSNAQTSLVVSCDDYKYQIIFIDHYTRYICLYHLNNKYDIHDIFVHWWKNISNVPLLLFAQIMVETRYS